MPHYLTKISWQQLTVTQFIEMPLLFLKQLLSLALMTKRIETDVSVARETEFKKKL